MAVDATKDLKRICDDLGQKNGYVGFGKIPKEEEYNKLDMLKEAIVTLHGEGFIDEEQKHSLDNSLKRIGRICGIKSRFP